MQKRLKGVKMLIADNFKAKRACLWKRLIANTRSAVLRSVIAVCITAIHRCQLLAF